MFYYSVHATRVETEKRRSFGEALGVHVSVLAGAVVDAGILNPSTRSSRRFHHIETLERCQ